jgi:predicted RNA binding protein YcfA (HicA-like mRNA interferase family)
MNPKRLWERIQQGHVHNIDFGDFCRLIEAFGFVFERQSGTSHRIYRHADVRDKVNVQPRRDGSAKHYQVRQLQNAVLEYDLELGKEQQ